MDFQARKFSMALASFFILCIADSVVDVSTSMITPAPQIVKKRQSSDAYFRNDFIGYYLSGSTYLPSLCAGSSYRETSLAKSDNYFGGCISFSTYSAFTSCAGNWAYGVGRTTTSIGTGLTQTTTWSTSRSCAISCVSNYMVYTSDGPSTSYFVDCGRTAETLYRMRSDSLNYNVFMTTRPDPTTTPADSGPTATVTMTKDAPIPTIVTSPSSDKGPPIGPIVGGTIGGVALLVAVIAGVWFCLQKRRKDKTDAYAQSHNQPMPPVMSPQPYIYYSGQDKFSVPTTTYPQQQWGPGPGVSPTTTPPPVPSYMQQLVQQPLQQPVPQSARQSQNYQQPQIQPPSIQEPPLVQQPQSQQHQVQDPQIQHADIQTPSNHQPDKDSNFQKYST